MNAHTSSVKTVNRQYIRERKAEMQYIEKGEMEMHFVAFCGCQLYIAKQKE
ncbi:hypothetical protein T4B_14311 [Trichinella pseudospiralis]|uniref:Uncharacterized protein n=1 Tax=Trichinella pseudospiralis TaxID=6337 RepID=A0A0V1GSD5_TRIPS|nr:hypothetical protein T4B_14311 [Trichinella pseudospiralis]KRZ01180.1 hypothetical protein T4C_13561 [Trichinella pseudospiralis]